MKTVILAGMECLKLAFSGITVCVLYHSGNNSLYIIVRILKELTVSLVNYQNFIPLFQLNTWRTTNDVNDIATLF